MAKEAPQQTSLRPADTSGAGRAEHSADLGKALPHCSSRQPQPQPQAEPSPPSHLQNSVPPGHLDRCKPNQTSGHLIEKGTRRALLWQDTALGQSSAQHPTFSTTGKPQRVPE